MFSKNQALVFLKTLQYFRILKNSSLGKPFVHIHGRLLVLQTPNLNEVAYSTNSVILKTKIQSYYNAELIQKI